MTVLSPNCHSAVQTQTQREPEVFQKTHGYNAQTKGIQHEVMNGEAIKMIENVVEFFTNTQHWHYLHQGLYCVKKIPVTKYSQK